MKSKGFTLIEIMVVISVISVMSSVVMVSVNSARERARDATRIQQLRQIDNAIQMYKADHNGEAPHLDSLGKKADDSPLCKAQSASLGPAISLESASACFAVSTADPNSDQGKAWTALRNDLAPYLSDFPDDPCFGGCEGADGLDTAYYYTSPFALQYSCQQSSSCNADVYDDDYWDDLYQLYGNLESDDEDYIVFDADEDLFDVYYYDSEGPTTPAGLSASSITTNSLVLTWTASTDEYTEVLGYTVFRDGDELQTVGSGRFTDTGLTPDTSYTYTVIAYDELGNESDESGALSVRTAVANVITPVISNLTTSATQSRVTINWTTNIPTHSVVTVGPDPFYGSISQESISFSSTSHSVRVSNLVPGTTYNYNIQSISDYGVSSISPDSTFTTLSIGPVVGP